MTQEIFGCMPDELYAETGGKKGDRSTLPQDAQTAYMVGEVAATHRLKETEIDGNQSQRNAQIVDTVQSSSREVKGLFPWNRRRD
jgi:alanyl-tRNA synthetase